jgi:ligand-binding sensor domain-containing protein
MGLRTYAASRALVVTSLLTLLSVGIAVGLYLHSVDSERERAGSVADVVVEEQSLVPPDATGVTLWLASSPAVDVEPFDGMIYAATGSGLEVYDETGKLARRYTTLDGLPENTLTCLERFRDRLFIGTATGGLVAFDGSRFSRYRFLRPSASRVTALRAVNGELLVGTFDAGLFEYDGSEWTRRTQSTLGDGCRRVTALLESGPRLYVGTYDSGLFEWRQGAARNLRKADGLGSDRVTGLAAGEQAVYAATDLGVARIGADGTAALVEPAPNATGVAVRDGLVQVSTLTTGVSTFPDDPGAAAVRPASSSISQGEALGVKVEDAILWVLARDGIYASTSSTGRLERFAGGERRGLSAAHVSALSLDARGRVWAGYFDGGLDILDPRTGERLERIDDPAVYEVNAIVAEGEGGRVLVASSKGLAAFDGPRLAKLYDERDGLVGSNVAAVTTAAGRDGGQMALATSRGVTVHDGARARSVTSFHGLPNNHAYAVAALGGKTYVGTLGGLAELDGLRVTRTFSTSTSTLPHNWINALVALDGRLYVGTYGGGVAVLMPTGQLAVFEETSGLEINPGAMLALGSRVYAGTLDSGLWALDVGSGRWTKITAALASTNVTAIAADGEYLYVGTEHGITRIARTSLS